MGVPFQVDVNVTTHGAEKVDALEKKLNALQTKGVDIKVNVDGLDKLDTSKLDKQATSAGKQFSQNFSKGFSSSSGKSKINNPIDFAQMKKDAEKEVESISKTLQSVMGLPEKESTKLAKDYINENKKNLETAQKERNRYAKQYEQEQQRQAKQIESAQKRINSNEFEARNAKADKFLSNYANQSSEVLEKARKMNAELKTMQTDMQNGFYSTGENKGMQILGKDLDSMIKTYDEKKKQLKNIFTEISNTESQTLGKGIAQKDANEVQTYINANTKALKKYGDELRSVQELRKNALTVEDRQEATNQFSNLKSRISAEGLTGKSGWDEFKRAAGQIAQFTGIYGAIQNIGMEIPSQMISAVKDVNAAQIELTKVSNASNTQLSQYWDEAADSAQKYGSTISDVISSTADWSRLGYNLDDAKKLSDTTTLLQKVGDNMTQESSSQGLISTLKGFQMEADEASKIVDVVNEVNISCLLVQ
mgnify:CR=1 FL=1|nr:hypothetical protein [uncultured Lachnoclostridium sp.]